MRKWGSKVVRGFFSLQVVSFEPGLEHKHPGDQDDKTGSHAIRCRLKSDLLLLPKVNGLEFLCLILLLQTNLNNLKTGIPVFRSF